MRRHLAISVRQPWASLLVLGLKTVEIRSWLTDYRGRLLIHASKTVDSAASKRLHLEGLPLGCLIGSADLVGVEPMTSELWDELGDLHLQHGPYPGGLYAWRFDRPLVLPAPVSYRGELGLFSVLLPDACLPTDLGRSGNPHEGHGG